MTGATKARHRSSGMLVPTLLVAAATVLGIAAIWLLAVPLGPEACGLSMPGPRNCFASDRAHAAVAATVALVLLGAMAVLAAVFLPRWRRTVAVLGASVVLIASAAAYLSAAWVPAWAFPWSN